MVTRNRNKEILRATNWQQQQQQQQNREIKIPI